MFKINCASYYVMLNMYRAFMTFHHQTIFDPRERCMKPLHPFEQSAHNKLYPTYLHLTSDLATSELFPFLGCIILDKGVATGIADGLVDPNTLEEFRLPEPLEDVSQLNRRHSDSSIKHRKSSSSSGSNYSDNFSRVSYLKRESPFSKQSACESMLYAPYVSIYIHLL